MASWEHGGGFSLDASVCIEANDRSGLERLLRYCARPVFALERLRQIDAEHLVYESVKPGPGGSVSLLMTPLELIERLAALIPPPHRRPACRARRPRGGRETAGRTDPSSGGPLSLGAAARAHL